MLSNYTHTHTHTHTHVCTHTLSPKRQSLQHCPCVQQQYIKLGDAGIEILPSCPTFQHQSQRVWSTTIPSNFSTPGSGMVYYHPVQLFNTRVWYGLLPSRPTFKHQGLVWSTTIPSNFSTPGSGMVYYHSIQLFTTMVNG